MVQKRKRTIKKKTKNKKINLRDCLYWNWKGCKIKKKRTRKGKIGNFFKNKFVKGALATVAPSVAAIGIGLVKTLMKKNTGYSDIYA